MEEWRNCQWRNEGTVNGGMEEPSMEEWRNSLWKNGGTVNGGMEELSMEEWRNSQFTDSLVNQHFRQNEAYPAVSRKPAG